MVILALVSDPEYLSSFLDPSLGNVRLNSSLGDLSGGETVRIIREPRRSGKRVFVELKPRKNCSR